MIDPADHFLDVHALSRRYLALPRAYVDELGGLRWSENMDGLVFSSGGLAMANESLALFLEGFAPQRPLLAFGSMLHWAMLFGTTAADVELSRLGKGFQNHGANWRNAGALAGMMSDRLAAAAEPPPVHLLCDRLRERAFPIRWFTGAMNSSLNGAEAPAHTLADFTQHVRRALAVLSDEDLEAWLKYGRGPVRRAGEALAREQPPPRFIGKLFDELWQRPRLAGAQAYVPQMVMALSVPPRRQSPDQLPMGGYVDVVTHGSVDRLLPSQHALDDLEFLRRFSEHELLYFRREEPPAQLRQEVVVVLDQGVRTWGDVRLVLTAAALALTKHADHRKLDFRLACTSRAGLFVNPLGEANPNFGPALEASDLTRNPGRALESVLEWPSAVPRDIFLLTHPFSLYEEDVQVAARRLGAYDRLFALTVSAGGDAELVQLRRGLPVRLRTFRVDTIPATTTAAQASPIAAPTWTGAVEPVAWPFRFGSDSPVHLFDFDDSGAYLFAVMEDSMIHSWNLLNGDHEILPRPQRRGHFKMWDQVVGVVGGFVLLGPMDQNWNLVHYDRHRRHVTLHVLPYSATVSLSVAYVRQWHSVVLTIGQSPAPVLAIDLATSEWSYGEDHQRKGAIEAGYVVEVAMADYSPPERASSRADQAFQAFTTTGPRLDVLPNLAIYDPRADRSQFANARPGYAFDFKDGRLTIWDGVRLWPTIAPQTEGSQALVNANIDEIRLAGNTLAVQYKTPRRQGLERVLAFFRGPDGHFLRETHCEPAHVPVRWEFRLTKDGAKVGMLRNRRQLEVQLTERPQRILYTRTGGFGSQSRLWVAEDGMLLRCGRKGYAWQLMEWSQGKLEVFTDMKPLSEPSYQMFQHPRIRDFLRNRDLEEVVRSPFAFLGNPERWPCALQRYRGWFVLDRFGQVLVFDAERTNVFQFLGHGDSWTAWLPDGSRHGLGMVHTWPNSPNALRRMGQALQQVTREGRP